jgi:hypothetical protein
LQLRHIREIAAANEVAREWRRRACLEIFEPVSEAGIIACAISELCVPLFCIPAALLVFVILIAVSTDSVTAISTTQIFLPIYIAMSAFGLVLLVMCMSREGSQRLYRRSVGVVKHICCNLFYDDDRFDRTTTIKFFSYSLSVVAFTGVLLTVVFVNLKLNGDVHWSWPRVMIPLWVAMSMACYTSCVKCCGDNSNVGLFLQVGILAS